MRKTHSLTFLLASVTLALAGGVTLYSCLSHSDATHVDVVDYNFHIRPIFSDKCFKCHGPDANERQADLRLDTKEGLYQSLKDHPDQMVISPGEPKKSELYKRIMTQDSADIMPPPDANLNLTALEKKLISKWIDQGAEYKEHWSFTPPQKTALPQIKDSEWAQNDIDYFILQKLGVQRLSANPPADRTQLLKRVSFDLTGLPPSIKMQEAFYHDHDENAYEKVVDELLSSPAYGERMALHWLDVARYADSHGYQDDGLRTMWPWRDWVIHAFNENYPYDKFLTWQLAGDLLPDPDKEMLLATGFNRNHKITQEGGVIDEEYRIEYVTDRTNTFGKAFLGMTFECAKCHDHKYDPISQKEYFRAFAFFDQVPEKGIVGVIDASFADPPKMEISNEDIASVLHFVNKPDTNLLEVMIMHDSSGIRATRVLDRGVYDNPTDTVFPQMPKSIMPYDTSRFAPNRLGLAQWLLDENNPLTARVFANRMWQEIFGRGLVKTSGDYGMQGDLPSHPQLLDWLAVDFRDSGWDIKQLIKTIVMSATYRQSAQVSDKKLTADPDNIWLSRAPRIRLPAENIRDHVLVSAGLLHQEIGGPSVKPYEPGDIWGTATSGRGLLMNYIQDHGNQLYRRGMYTFVKRTIPPPTMLVFDSSNRDQCEVQRLRTNTPLQALAMMNDETVLEAARVFAEKLIAEKSTVSEKIAIAFQSIICRPIEEPEKTLLKEYYQEELNHFQTEPELAVKFISAGEIKNADQVDSLEVAALMQIIHTIYNMEEAITKS